MIFTKEHKTHHLKIYPEHFSAVMTGVKRAELRKNDRDFKVGDTLHLMETPKSSCKTTGEFVNAVITHIADVGDWLPGYVLLSIEREMVHTAPPAPVSVPDEIQKLKDGRGFRYVKDGVHYSVNYANGWNQCRAAMLQGAEPVTKECRLPEDFDFDRFNDLVWLEAVASNPHMHSPTTSTIAMVALELNRKLAAGNSPAIPDGWKLVPVELTGAMTNAMTDAILDDLHNVDVWRSVLSAAPLQEAE